MHLCVLGAAWILSIVLQGKVVSFFPISFSLLHFALDYWTSWGLGVCFCFVGILCCLGDWRVMSVVGGRDMADSPSAPLDIGFVSAAKAIHDSKVAERRQRLLARLQWEAKVVERKAQASKQALKAKARK